MKRYDVVPKMGRGRQLFVKGVETEEGKYVQFKDVEKIIKRLLFLYSNKSFEEIFDLIEKLEKEI